MSNLVDLYKKMIKAKQHYQHITTFENFEKFYKIENELFRELDNIQLNENIWINNNKCLKCIKCDYNIFYNDVTIPELIKYKQLIHQEFICK